MHSVLPVPFSSSCTTTLPEKSTASGFDTAPQWLVGLTAWLRKAAGWRLLVYPVFTVLYLIPTVWLCRMKLFWDDEFFTFYLARTPNWHTLIQALSTGADQHPPAFYYLTHWLMQVFGTSHLVVRLPSVVAFWLFCVCVYEIVRLLASPPWAVVGMLFPLATNFYYYASEARGYALVAGFTALAMLSWLEITKNRHRTLFLPLLAFSLAAAVSSHYYAVLTTFSLVVGELVRTRARRRFDLPVWIAFAFTLVPILAFLPVIRSASHYSAGFWATPLWSEALLFYPTELGLGVFPLLGLVAIAVSFGFNLSGWTGIETEASLRHDSLQSWEAVALCLLAVLPIGAMLLAKFITHGFTYRYAISAVVGITVLVAYVLSRIAPRSIAALAAAITCFFIFVLQVHLLAGRFRYERKVYSGYTALLSQTGTQPIAISEWPVMHRLSFYAPRALASRVIYVADVDASLKYLGQSTIDQGALALRPWFPLQIESVPSFLAHNRHFLVFGLNADHWNWLFNGLPQWGDATLVSAHEMEGRVLFSEDHLRVTPDPKLIEQQRTAESLALFSTLPRTGPSLCALWMGPKDCP